MLNGSSSDRDRDSHGDGHGEGKAYVGVPWLAVVDHALCSPSLSPSLPQALMITQYSSKLVVPLFELQHALLARITSSPALAKSGSEGARRAQRLAGLVGDARVLFRIWGILPILKWVSAALARCSFFFALFGPREFFLLSQPTQAHRSRSPCLFSAR